MLSKHNTWYLNIFHISGCYLNYFWCHQQLFLKNANYNLQWISLTLFFSMSSFDPPENIKKPLVFWCFQGDQKGTLGKKGLKVIYSNVISWFIRCILSDLHSKKFSLYSKEFSAILEKLFSKTWRNQVQLDMAREPWKHLYCKFRLPVPLSNFRRRALILVH